jgi:hypothetical protein
VTGGSLGRWLGFHEPDPSGTHYAAICDAADTLLTEFDVPAADLFVWIEYAGAVQM